MPRIFRLFCKAIGMVQDEVEATEDVRRHLDDLNACFVGPDRGAKRRDAYRHRSGCSNGGIGVSANRQMKPGSRFTFICARRFCYHAFYPRYNVGTMAKPTPMSGAVACEQVRASRIGTQILQDGGNAADAIIATIIAVNTLAPFHSDIGGGGFAIIREPSGRYQALDFRHTAPVSIKTSQLPHPLIPQRDVTMAFYQAGASTSIGGSSVAVPGQMKGLEELHKRYGRLPWRQLLEPSISMAENGMEMREDLSEVSYNSGKADQAVHATRMCSSRVGR